MREEFKNVYDGTKLIFTEEGIEFYSPKEQYNIPFNCILKISKGAMNCINIKLNDKKLIVFRDPDGDKERMSKMITYTQKAMIKSNDATPHSSQSQEFTLTEEFDLTPSEENEIKVHKKSVIILIVGIIVMMFGYFHPIAGGIGGLIIVLGIIIFFKFRSKSMIFYAKRKSQQQANIMIANAKYKLNIDDSDSSKTTSETKNIIKGAVVGGIIGGEAGAVVGAIVEKNKIDKKNKK